MLGVRPARSAPTARPSRRSASAAPITRACAAARRREAEAAARCAARRASRSRTGNAPVTKALIALNVAIYLIDGRARAPASTARVERHQPGSLSPTHGSSSGRTCAHGDWYRLVTAMFLHAIDPPHRLQHVRALRDRDAGRAVPRQGALPRALSSSRAWPGSAGALSSRRYVPVLGASGAIFGILGAMLILEWQVTGRLAGQAMTLDRDQPRPIVRRSRASRGAATSAA